MITKTIQYHDLDGDLREDEFCFSMNETQYARVNGLFPGGLEDYALKAAKDKNADAMFKVVDTLVREAYGERKGKDFVKVLPDGQKLADFFINTEAYDNLLMEVMSSEDNLVAFMSGCLNKNAQDRVQAELNRRKEEARKAQKEAAGSDANSNEKPSLAVLDGKVE